MIKAIVAMSEDSRGIGKDNKLPWYIPGDLKFFKEQTLGAIVVMGYNTMLSLPKGPLPNRTNLVIVRSNTDKLPEGFTAVLESDALGLIKELSYKGELVWIIGGAKTYKLFEDVIEEWYITHVSAPGVEFDTYLDLDLSRYSDPAAAWKGGLSPAMVKLNVDKKEGDPVEAWYHRTYTKKDEFKVCPMDLKPVYMDSTLSNAWAVYGEVYEKMFGPLINYIHRTHPTHSCYHSSHHLAACGALMFVIHAHYTANGAEHRFVSRATKLLATAMLFHDYYHQNAKEDQLNIQAATDEFMEVYRTKRELFAYIGELTDTELVRICSLINYTTYDFDNPYPSAPQGDNEFVFGLVRDIDQLYACAYFSPDIFEALYEDIGKRFDYDRKHFIKRNVDYIAGLNTYTDEVGSIHNYVAKLAIKAHEQL